MGDHLIAIVPARAGSKGLSGKNLRPLAGIPLVQRAVQTALHSDVFSAVYVTSDDADILDLATRCGAVPIRRPAALASDRAVMVDVVLHVGDVLQTSAGRAFALLQPTSPLRTSIQIRECARAFLGGSWASAVSVCPLEHPPQKSLVIRDGKLEPLLGGQYLHKNRQELEPAFRQNGSIWIANWEAFRRERRFVISPAMPFCMDTRDSIDIDTPEDLRRAEVMLVGGNANQQ